MTSLALTQNYMVSWSRRPQYEILPPSKPQIITEATSYSGTFAWQFLPWENKYYEACPEIKDTKVLNMYTIFNLQKRHCEWIACTKLYFSTKLPALSKHLWSLGTSFCVPESQKSAVCPLKNVMTSSCISSSS